MSLQLAQTSAMSDALALAFSIRQALSGPASLFVEEDGTRITVEGRLNLSHEEIVTRAKALCTFIVPLAWRQIHPLVWCREPWRKLPLPGGVCNAEWHVLGQGNLCYELQHRWQDEISAATLAGGSDAAVELAGDWVLNSVRWLLYRHLEAFRRNLSHWDSQWLAWRHYERGPRQYLQMKSRKAQAERLKTCAKAA